MIGHWRSSATRRRRSSVPAVGSVVCLAVTESATVETTAASEIVRKTTRQAAIGHVTAKYAPTISGATTAATWLEVPWIPIARPTRVGNSSLTSGFAETK